METDQIVEESHKKGRQRKKQLYASVLQQMEFYFSDSNLNKDRFLGQLLDKSEFIDIDIFLKFNKIRKLTSSVNDLLKSVKKSTFLEISEDQTKIKRKTPVKFKENIDECTIYVQHLKSDTTHEWLSNVFAEFGNVVYVSIPKYKQNKLNKGFAFVEFDSENEARTTVEYFESIGCKISSQTAPEELCSVATFEGDGDDKVKNRFNRNENNKNYEECKIEENKIEECKTVEDIKETIGESTKKRKLSEVDPEKNEELVTKKLKPEEDEKLEIDMEDVSNDKKKHKKLKKLKAHFKELGLQILPKREWKKMRNRYLEMQRAKMQQLKTHLYKKQFNNTKSEGKSKQPIENIAKIEEIGKIKDEKLSFIAGVIVKVKLPESGDSKKIKNEIKNTCPDAKYIEVPCTLNNDEVFVRFSNTENAKKFCASNYKGGKLLILDGDEEKQYWDKLQIERSAKFQKEYKKQRGRDKLLKKAERELGKHIRFDDVN